MANDDYIPGRGGLLPVEFYTGNYRKNYYKVLTSATVGVYIGQPMDVDGNGNAFPAQANSAGVSFIAGPATGFTDLTKGALPAAMLLLTAGPFLPANTDAYVQIADDPDQVFYIQVGTDSTALGTAGIGGTSTFYFRATSGSNTTGYSTAELSSNLFSTANSGSLQIMGGMDYKNSDGTTNDLASNYAKVRVRIQAHRFGGRAGGTGTAV